MRDHISEAKNNETLLGHQKPIKGDSDEGEHPGAERPPCLELGKPAHGFRRLAQNVAAGWRLPVVAGPVGLEQGFAGGKFRFRGDAVGLDQLVDRDAGRRFAPVCREEFNLAENALAFVGGRETAGREFRVNCLDGVGRALRGREPLDLVEEVVGGFGGRRDCGRDHEKDRCKCELVRGLIHRVSPCRRP